MTPLDGDSTDAIRRRVAETHRRTRQQRLDDLQVEARQLKREIRDHVKAYNAALTPLIARHALLEGRVHAMQQELRGDETTVRLPLLPS